MLERRLESTAPSECFLLDIWLYSGLERPNSKPDSTLSAPSDFLYGYDSIHVGEVFTTGMQLVMDITNKGYNTAWTQEMERRHQAKTDSCVVMSRSVTLRTKNITGDSEPETTRSRVKSVSHRKNILEAFHPSNRSQACLFSYIPSYIHRALRSSPAPPN